MSSDPEMEFIVKSMIREMGDPRPFLCEPDTNPPIPEGLLKRMWERDNKALPEQEKYDIQRSVTWKDDRWDQPVLN